MRGSHNALTRLTQGADFDTPSRRNLFHEKGEDRPDQLGSGHLRGMGSLLCPQNGKMKPQTEKIFHHTFSTRFGPVVLLWARSGDHVKVSRLWLSTCEMPAGENLKRIVPFSKALSCHDVDRLAGLIKAFLMGDDVSFSLA